ncbi:hypothetical protein QW180_18210 [Vibrio sinaloensis]|nr:hypothetical protein [Vibrio sinaloensis]
MSTSRLIHGSADESLLSLNYFARLNAQTYLNAVLSSSSYNGYKYISANSEISYTLANDWEVTVGGGYNRAESEEGFILRSDSNDEFFCLSQTFYPFQSPLGFLNLPIRSKKQIPPVVTKFSTRVSLSTVRQCTLTLKKASRRM